MGASFSTAKEIFSGKVFQFETGFHWENYVNAWKSQNVAKFFANSLLYAVTGCIGTLLISAPGAYVLSRFDFFANKPLKSGLIIAMSIPAVMIIMPIFALTTQLGIKGRILLILLYILMHVPSTTTYLLNFFATLSKTYEEAAAIDGCPPARTFWVIMLPLVQPAIITVTIFNFLGIWNEFFMALIFASSAEMTPVGVGLLQIVNGMKYTGDYGGLFAAVVIVFLPTFHEGGDPVKEAKVNWVTARRAILRKPIDRIGYGGYLKLAAEFPDFVEYVESVCAEFRELYENIRGTTPYCVKKVAVLNCWGKMRAWGCHMVHHALYQKQNYSYAGIIEALSGAPFDVKFISFEDILADKNILKDIDVIINVGDADTAHTGGEYWCHPEIVSAIKEFVYNGGGIIGVGEPSGHQANGRFFQLANVFGVEEERDFTLGYDKYNWDTHSHFITEDAKGVIDFGESRKYIYALEGTQVLEQQDKEVHLAVNEFGRGRAVYMSGLPYSFENSRLLYRAILWSAGDEENIHKWFSTNYNVEVHAYVANGKYCAVNNTYEPQSTTVYKGDGTSFELDMEANQIIWYEI